MKNNILESNGEKPKYLDEKYSLEERKRFYKEEIDKMMNPIKDFNPDDFDISCPEELKPFARKRVKPDKILPTFDLLPKEIRIGQMIGMWESKGDLYLIFAHKCNELQAEIDSLKEEIRKLKNKEQ